MNVATIREIVTGTLSVIIIGGAVYTLIAHIPSDTAFDVLTGGVIGYYFTRGGVSLGNSINTNTNGEPPTSGGSKSNG